MTITIRRTTAALCLTILAAAPAYATPVVSDPITFKAVWTTGTSEPKSFTGLFTLERSVLTDKPILLKKSSPELLSAYLTLGNGEAVEWKETSTLRISHVAGLDFSKELVGQKLSDQCVFGPIIRSHGDCAYGDNGVFTVNVFPTSIRSNGAFQQHINVGDMRGIYALSSLTVVNEVPEPLSITLFGVAAAGMAVARRRRQSS